MDKVYETAERPKRAFLAGIRNTAAPKTEAGSMARELAGLAHTLGLEIVAQETVTVREKNPKFGMGSGKVQELAEKAAALEADCFIFDWEPTPSQQRNWETLSGLPVVDRQELIIRIFAERAVTREAELQVKLAELSYSLPRLTHKYIDLSRQRGGRYGTRGAGETRLETDRRLVEKRIRALERELEEVRRQRGVRRRQRERRETPVCAIVGYTNAGKSSLFNALTGADVPAEDKLFATLDAASRRFEPAKDRPVLLVDTVGFIRRLPHALVDAFRATLEEVRLADLIIHVLDASESDMDVFYAATLSVLRELDAGKIPAITVLNKIDRLESPDLLEGLKRRYDGCVPVSALTGAGLAELSARIDHCLSASRAGQNRVFRFPPGRTDLAAQLHRSGMVRSETYEPGYIEMEAQVDEKTAGRLREYLIGEG
ncbi:MAG: GTPase HflX [Treponema sp.]|nr:GTPase HflX [Treponema sp.]